jgi:hypothetical protein
MPAKTWNGTLLPLGKLWSNAANWLPVGAPGAGDDVVFDGSSSGLDCIIDSATISITSLSTTTGYPGTITAGAVVASVTGDFSVLGGNLICGSSQWTIGGNYESAGNTVKHSLDTVTLTGTGKTIHSLAESFNLANTSAFNNLTCAGQHTLTSTDASNSFGVNGILRIVAGHSLTLNRAINPVVDLKVETGATIDGNKFVNGLTRISQQDGTISCADATPGPNFGFGVSFKVGSSSVPTTINAGVVLTGTTLDAGTFEIRGRLSAFAAVHNEVNNPNVVVHGNVLIPASIWTRGTGTLTLAGTAGTQTIDTNGNSLEAVVVNAAGAVKQLNTNLTAAGLTINAGTLDHNGKTITLDSVGTGFTVNAPGQVAANNVGPLTTPSFTLNGTAANPITWSSTVVQPLTVSGAGLAHYTTAHNSNASGSASAIQANDGTNTDNLGNTNWNFILSTARYWTGATPGLFTDARWAYVSGGPPIAPVPTIANDIFFDGMGAGDFTANTFAGKSVRVAASFPSTLTFNTLTTSICDGDFLIDGGRLSVGEMVLQINGNARIACISASFDGAILLYGNWEDAREPYGTTVITWSSRSTLEFRGANKTAHFGHDEQTHFATVLFHAETTLTGQECLATVLIQLFDNVHVHLVPPASILGVIGGDLNLFKDSLVDSTVPGNNQVYIQGGRLQGFGGFVGNIACRELRLENNISVANQSYSCGLLALNGRLGSGNYSFDGDFTGSLNNSANPNLNVTGNWASDNGYLKGTGTLTLTGSDSTVSAQTPIEALVINASGEKRLASNLTIGGAVNVLAGTLDTNGLNITSQGFFVSSPGHLRPGGSGLNGSHFTVIGDCTFTGTAGDRQNLRGTAPWFISCSGNLSAHYADLEFSDASGGSRGDATDNSVDYGLGAGGDNINWFFTPLTTMFDDTRPQRPQPGKDVTQYNAVQPIYFNLWGGLGLTPPSTEGSPISGAVVQARIVKSDGTFATPSGIITNIVGNLYKLAPNIADANTIGISQLQFQDVAGASYTTIINFSVLAVDPFDPNGGLDNLDVPVSSRESESLANSRFTTLQDRLEQPLYNISQRTIEIPLGSTEPVQFLLSNNPPVSAAVVVGTAISPAAGTLQLIAGAGWVFTPAATDTATLPCMFVFANGAGGVTVVYCVEAIAETEAAAASRAVINQAEHDATQALLNSQYFCDGEMDRDTSPNADEHSCTWYRNDQLLTSGVTNPTIEVEDAISGAVLIPQTAMIAAGRGFTYTATGSQRMTLGSTIRVIYRATIDGGTRTIARLIRRDK